MNQKPPWKPSHILILDDGHKEKKIKVMEYRNYLFTHNDWKNDQQPRFRLRDRILLVDDKPVYSKFSRWQLKSI